jgi:hypothetical protein
MNEMKQLEDMCAAVPPPGPQRLAGARARVLTAIAEGRAAPPKPGRRWPRWVAPLAAAAAVTAAVAVAATISGAIRGSGSARYRPAASTAYTIYVEIFGPPAGQDGLVPISTATNTPGKPIHIRGMSGVAITPDGKTIYAGTGDTVVPVSTATNTPSRPIHFRGRVSTIAVNPDGKTAYVEVDPRRRGPAPALVPVSTATNTPGKPIPLRGPVNGIEILITRGPATSV